MINIHQIHALADDCPYDLRQGVQTLSDDQECLGVGADLSVATLLHAYRSGVFPWFHDKPIA
ncbi:hypothetical protein [Moraxella bovis]|nr:hypothetical protein [Moraxella bovis]AWY19992.1 hypothetical protein DQF64_05440 [Moraxella bovis]